MAQQEEKIQEKTVKWGADALNGRIISLASLRGGDQGKYLDAHHEKKAKITGCNYTDVIFTNWLKFLVHKVNNNTIVLESIRYRNNYVDAHHSKVVHITHQNNPPLNANWAQWKIVGDDPANIKLESVRYKGSWLDAHHSGYARVTASNNVGDWGKWRVVIGDPREGMSDADELVDDFTNESDTIVKHTFTYKVGMSKAKGKSSETTLAVGMEAQQNFGCPAFTSGSIKMSVNFSQTWSSSSNETWTEETTKSMEMNVEPGKTIRIYQIRGKYGPYKIGASKFRVSNQ